MTRIWSVPYSRHTFPQVTTANSRAMTEALTRQWSMATTSQPNSLASSYMASLTKSGYTAQPRRQSTDSSQRMRVEVPGKSVAGPSAPSEMSQEEKSREQTKEPKPKARQARGRRKGSVGSSSRRSSFGGSIGGSQAGSRRGSGSVAGERHRSGSCGSSRRGSREQTLLECLVIDGRRGSIVDDDGVPWEGMGESMTRRTVMMNLHWH